MYNSRYYHSEEHEKEMSAFMLIATNLAKKMSIDMRLINSESYSFEPDGKVGRLCSTVAEEYRDSQNYKGTQLIFSDIGTPAGNSFNLYQEIKRVLVQDHGLKVGELLFKPEEGRPMHSFGLGDNHTRAPVRTKPVSNLACLAQHAVLRALGLALVPQA